MDWRTNQKTILKTERVITMDEELCSDRNIITLRISCLITCPECNKEIDLEEHWADDEEFVNFIVEVHTTGYKPNHDIECPHCEKEFTCTYLEYL
jgi:hypothetical protein